MVRLSFGQDAAAGGNHLNRMGFSRHPVIRVRRQQNDVGHVAFVFSLSKASAA